MRGPNRAPPVALCARCHGGHGHAVAPRHRPQPTWRPRMALRGAWPEFRPGGGVNGRLDTVAIAGPLAPDGKRRALRRAEHAPVGGSPHRRVPRGPLNTGRTWRRGTCAQRDTRQVHASRQPFSPTNPTRSADTRPSSFPTRAEHGEHLHHAYEVARPNRFDQMGIEANARGVLAEREAAIPVKATSARAGILRRSSRPRACPSSSPR